MSLGDNSCVHSCCVNHKKRERARERKQQRAICQFFGQRLELLGRFDGANTVIHYDMVVNKLEERKGVGNCPHAASRKAFYGASIERVALVLFLPLFVERPSAPTTIQQYPPKLATAQCYAHFWGRSLFG